MIPKKPLKTMFHSVAEWLNLFHRFQADKTLWSLIWYSQMFVEFGGVFICEHRKCSTTKNMLLFLHSFRWYFHLMFVLFAWRSDNGLHSFCCEVDNGKWFRWFLLLIKSLVIFLKKPLLTTTSFMYLHSFSLITLRASMYFLRKSETLNYSLCSMCVRAT